MIFDLDKNKVTEVEKVVDVNIIGAGTAGLYLADRLKDSGLKVLVIEEGFDRGKMSEFFDKSVINSGIKYDGASKGRSFGLGGTSSLWGGQMITLSPSDFKERYDLGFSKWPIKYVDLEVHFKRVREKLGLKNYKESELVSMKKKKLPLLYNFNKYLNLRLSQWIPFNKRNFGKFFRNKIQSSKTVEVWLNASLKTIVKSDQNKTYEVTKIVAQGRGGNKLIVKAKYFIICAGAIESTRILLQFDDDNDNCITKNNSPLGLFFSDHLSVNIGKILPFNFKDINFKLAPIFYKGIMHTPRLEISEKFQIQKKIPSAFIHFLFKTNGKTIFDFVRDFLRTKQDSRKVENKYSVLFFIRGLIDLYLMIFWRYVYKRLRFPSNSDVLMQIDFEQLPNINSKIYLIDSLDKLGGKKVGVEWLLKEGELEIINEALENAVDFYNKSELTSSAKLDINPLNKELNIDNIYDVYHPTGTISMGECEQESVVNSNLKLWNCNNLYVSSTAVFPSPGSANPGLTHLALTDRLAQHLVHNFNNIGG